jgi:F-type H+-transporting ATPase subunit delta
MINPKIVRNYAYCLFDNIKSDKEHKLVLEQISLLDEVLQSSSLAHFVFCTPVISRWKKLKLIESIGKKFHFEKVVGQFFSVITKNSRFNILSSIVKEYEKLLTESRGVKTVTLESANKPGPKELGVIKKYLEEKLQKIVEFKLQEDKSLIGGAVIKYDSLLYDYSIAGAIERAAKLAKEVEV